jgi:hypothetical protein
MRHGVDRRLSSVVVDASGRCTEAGLGVTEAYVEWVGYRTAYFTMTQPNGSCSVANARNGFAQDIATLAQARKSQPTWERDALGRVADDLRNMKFEDTEGCNASTFRCGCILTPG